MGTTSGLTMPSQMIRTLCRTFDLDFLPSDASYAELRLRNDDKARATQAAWRLFAKGLKNGRVLHEPVYLRELLLFDPLSFDFIDDPDDRVIVREFARGDADVLLTSDNDILVHKKQLAGFGINVMRPSEWLNVFLDNLRDDEDAVDWLERVLLGIGG